MIFIQEVNKLNIAFDIYSVICPKPVHTSHHPLCHFNNLVKGCFSHSHSDKFHILASCSWPGDITEGSHFFGAMNVFRRVKLWWPLVWDLVHLKLLALSTICNVIVPVAHKVKPHWVFFWSVSYTMWACENLSQQQQGQEHFGLIHLSNQPPLPHHRWHWNELQKFAEPEVHLKKLVYKPMVFVHKWANN